MLSSPREVLQVAVNREAKCNNNNNNNNNNIMQGVHNFQKLIFL
jgi:hypothetical protein